MNQRIQALAEKANIEFTYDPTETPIRAFAECWEDELEKFAELIVRECLGCSNNLANHYIDNHSEKEQTLLLASIADYSNEIKKHFGVKE
jgi:hypothetical protein